MHGYDVQAILMTENDYVEKVHNKGAIIDGDKVLISSINWGDNSILKNREMGFSFIQNSSLNHISAHGGKIGIERMTRLIAMQMVCLIGGKSNMDLTEPNEPCQLVFPKQIWTPIWMDSPMKNTWLEYVQEQPKLPTITRIKHKMAPMKRMIPLSQITPS